MTLIGFFGEGMAQWGFLGTGARLPMYNAHRPAIKRWEQS